jgi:DNA-binding NarL/FixJ family response regulator
MNPERSMMDARASAVLRELTCTDQDPLLAAVCAARESTARQLTQALASGGIEVTLVAHQPVGLLTELREHPVDAIVCVASAGERGIAEVRGLRGRPPNTQLVLVAGDVTRPRLRRMLDLGAQGVVLDSQISRALVPGVRAACGGLVCAPAALSEGMERGPLTTRQR